MEKVTTPGSHEANGCKTKVIGAPKTIDGDLKPLPKILGFIGKP